MPVAPLDASYRRQIAALYERSAFYREKLRAAGFANAAAAGGLGDIGRLPFTEKDELRASTEEAVARGAFGAPSIFFAGELYFGVDHLPFLERALQQSAQVARSEPKASEDPQA